MRVTVDILVTDDAWKQVKSVRSAARKIVRKVFSLQRPPVSDPCEVSLLLCGDDRIRELNRRWRNIDKATNVLSFQSKDFTPVLGDIAISYQTVEREAQLERRPFVDHFAHMVVHGCLHLLGYDHASEDEAITMEKLERDILQSLGVPDPYQTVRSRARDGAVVS
jgi:probable rRNA maturation factor